MQLPQTDTVTLEDILITEELSRRNPRAENLLKENQVLHALARQLVNQPQTMLQSIVDMAIDLCYAQSAGVSLLEMTPTGEEVFRAHVLAGALEQYVGGTTKRDFSPCGVCLERGTPVLYSYPERYFTDLQAANIPIVEALILPLIADNHALGTIWILSHNEQRHFDCEDVRIMTSLADFTAAALLLEGRQNHQLLAANSRLEAEVIERKRAEIALRESEEKYHTLLNSMDEAFCSIEVLYDEDGQPVDHQILEANPALEKHTGLTDARGRLASELLLEVEQSWNDLLARIVAIGESERLEQHSPAFDRWFDIEILRLGDETLRRVAVLFRDITDRKRREANLAFLAETSADFAPLLSVEEIMERVGKRLADFLNLSRCNFSVVDEEADRIECIYAWRRDDSMPNLFGAHRISAFLNEEGRRHYAAGKLSVINDTRTNPMLNPTFEMWDELGFGSIVDVPYLKDGRWKFLLTIARSEAGEWCEDEVELIRELAEQIYIRIERARAEESLRVSEEKYRTLFNSMDEAYAVVEVIPDKEGSWSDFLFLEVNPAFVKHTGMEYPVGRTATQILGTPNPQWAEIYGQVSETGEAVRIEMTEDILNRVFDLNIFRLGDLRSHRVAVLFTDITERKRAEDDRKCAQEAMRVFFSNVSHEFRTPLTLLLSSIQETLSDLAHPLSSAQRSQLQLAHRNAIRLLKLVNTLLDVSRIEAGHIQAVYEPTDLATLTTELASSFESAIEQAGLQLVVDCPPLRSPVYVDRSMWEKIVLNLLSNAFKFTFAGKITVRLTSASDSVELTVQDTGIGIAAAELPHLFERFYQVKGAKGRSFEGSGIGLSLVQELIKLHGGTIQVSSLEGEGSCFKVSIPAGFAHLPPQQIGSSRKGGFSKDASRQSEDSLQNPPLPSMATDATGYVEEALGWLPQEGNREQGIGNREKSYLSPVTCHLSPSSARILLVEDNADMRGYLKRLLSERWQVETAANGALALSLIQQNPPDLVLTDVMMPEMNGLQLLQALRTAPQTKSIPIILLSARATEEATVEGLAKGADDYLIKPFSARELMARVETHLQLARLRFERSANRFKDEFLMTVTHELQAPLATILGWARLLQTKSFDQTTTACALATIERNAMIEAKLVKDLLDVSSILSGKFQLKSQLVDLVSLVQNVMLAFQKAAQAKGIHLVETISNVAQSNVIADGDRIRQIIANLLENAIKFTSKGGRVNVQLEHFDSEVHITVTDTGIGISPDFLPYVFDRFTQAEVPSRHSPGGVGIGLAIARLLVELHHGTIEVASEGQGQGTTFKVRLPLMNPAQLNSDASAWEQ
jgi:signal transduction histidine kinase/GAF domain-containing protein